VRLLAGGDHEIRGLQIAMNDPLLVSVLQGKGGLPQDLRQRAPVLAWNRQERASVDKLHGDEAIARLVDLHDVRMVESGGGQGLPPETLVIFLLARPEELEGHPPVESGVPALPHLPHSSDPETLHPNVSADPIGGIFRRESNRRRKLLGRSGHVAGTEESLSNQEFAQPGKRSHLRLSELALKPPALVDLGVRDKSLFEEESSEDLIGFQGRRIL